MTDGVVLPVRAKFDCKSTTFPFMSTEGGGSSNDRVGLPPGGGPSRMRGEGENGSNDGRPDRPGPPSGLRRLYRRADDDDDDDDDADDDDGGDNDDEEDDNNDGNDDDKDNDLTTI